MPPRKIKPFQPTGSPILRMEIEKEELSPGESNRRSNRPSNRPSNRLSNRTKNPESGQWGKDKVPVQIGMLKKTAEFWKDKSSGIGASSYHLLNATADLIAAGVLRLNVT